MDHGGLKTGELFWNGPENFRSAEWREGGGEVVAMPILEESAGIYRPDASRFEDGIVWLN